jgi:hypothetical protein
LQGADRLLSSAQIDVQQYLRVADRTREAVGQLQRELAGLTAELDAADHQSPESVLADLTSQLGVLGTARSRVDDTMQQVLRDATAQRAAAEVHAQQMRDERATLQREVRPRGEG